MKLVISVGVFPVSLDTATIQSDEYLFLDLGTEVEEVSTELENPDINLYKVISGQEAGKHFVMTKKDAQTHLT